MREIMEWTVSIWNKYWGNGIFQYLLLFSAIYLLIRRRNKSSIRQVFPYLITVLLVFACPFTARIIQKCIGQDVYWRVLWLLPVTSVIALACTEFIEKRNSRLLRGLLLILFSGAIVLCGTNLLKSGEYVKVSNYQKVPEDVAQICNIIQEHAGDKEIRLASEEHVATYARVYDASIIMPYGRRGEGASSSYARRLYRVINDGVRNYRRMARLARFNKCNFLVITMGDTFDVADVEEYGYCQIGTVSQYGIFQRQKKH